MDCPSEKNHNFNDIERMFTAYSFPVKILGALSVGDGQKKPIPSLLPPQNHYLKSYRKEISIIFLIKSNLFYQQKHGAWQDHH
jgi:hypothetical protein